MLTFPSPIPQRVRDGEDARQLALHALSTERTRPLLVLTCRKDRQQPGIDPTSISTLVEGSIDVVFFASDDAETANETFNDALTAHGGAHRTVYNGAARLYPIEGEPRLYYMDTPPHRVGMLMDLTTRLVQAGLLDAAPDAAMLRQMVTHGSQRGERAFSLEEFENLHPAHVVRTAQQTRELVDLLLSPDRTMPVVVVAQSNRREHAFVDIDLISNTLYGLATVALLRSDEAVTEFKRRIVQPAWVFGDAGRVFPPGTAWNVPKPMIRLFLPNEHVSRMLFTNLMIKEALGMAADSVRRLHVPL